MGTRPRDLLARRNAGVLRRFAATHALLAFDFDGTLAPIVDDPDAARPRARTRRLLAALAERFPVAIISGRAADDVRARLGVEVAEVVGNHGIEPSGMMARAARETARIRPVLADRLAALPGVSLEDKRHSLSVHYRAARDHARARDAIHRAAAALPAAVRLVDGHCVVNVLPAGVPHKGDALRRLRDRLRVEATLFAGDDLTDEDAFAAQDRPGSLGVRVGRDRASRAAWYLAGQRDIDTLLERLLEARAGGAAPARRR